MRRCWRRVFRQVRALRRVRLYFSPDEAEEMAREGARVVLVRLETSPDDFHGMVAAQAIVTARGGMTSHAAVVARGMGKTCVSGANALNIDYSQQQFTVDGTVVTKGEWITVDGSTGRVFLGQVPTIQPTLGNDFYKLMTWADQFRRLRVRANADTPLDAKTARQFGAEGIGLCRTEHMFFGDQRLAAMREMILCRRCRRARKGARKVVAAAAWRLYRDLSRDGRTAGNDSACSIRRCTSFCRTLKSWAANLPS